MTNAELIVVDERTLPLVQHLRYRVYCAEKQFQLPGADPQARLLVDAADRAGVTFALFDGADIVSSAQVIPVDQTEMSGRYALFQLHEALPHPDHGAVIVSKLVTAPERRGSKTLGPVMRAVLDYVAREKQRYIAILAEPSMREFYGSMGFDIMKEGIQTEAFGMTALMVFDMQDERHTSGKSLAGWMFKSVFNR